MHQAAIVGAAVIFKPSDLRRELVEVARGNVVMLTCDYAAFQFKWVDSQAALYSHRAPAP